MRVHVIAIGRARGEHRTLCEDYARRMVWPFTLKEIDLRGGASAEKEGEALLASVPDGARIVVCDERGKNVPSEDFAAHLGHWRDGGVRDVVFLVGGADGHSHALRQRADFLLSFGKLTWPHMLARVMLMEQIYRAQQILAGHPYHRS